MRPADREDLFSAWRLLFERLAEQGPCALLFEDLQWADSALLDFIEYLLEWSRNHSLFVVTLARPELSERRSDWGAGKRNFHAIFLEPLPDEPMDELIRGLVPGLADELRARIRAHADGVPLYAVETVRMLVDRGFVERVGDAYRPVGPVDALQVPDSLQSLIAARLDGLDPQERRLVTDAAVLGKTFTREALSALGGLEAEELEPLLTSLVRKEILTVQADPWSPERGQYGFMQALVQTVAHDMLGRRDRKARHLAAARHLESWWGADEEEIVEVVAAHYLEAYRADADAEDAAEIKAAARAQLTHAGERAASLAAPAEAQRYFTQAAELADDDAERAKLLASAGETARAALRLVAAAELLERSAALYEEAGDERAAARTAVELARVTWQGGDNKAALEQMEAAFAQLSAGEADERVAYVAAELARYQFFAGNIARASETADIALDMAEAHRLAEPTAHALNTKALAIQARRPEEAYALLRRALELSLEHDLTSTALRSYNNLVFVELDRDNFDGALTLAQQGTELARRRGDRTLEAVLMSQQPDGLYLAGRWDEAIDVIDALTDETYAQVATLRTAVALPMARIHVARGNLDAPKAMLDDLEGNIHDHQELINAYSAKAIVSRGEGNYDEALTCVDRVLAFEDLVYALLRAEITAEGVEAALELGDLDRADRLVAEVEQAAPVKRSQYVEAHVARSRARILDARGDAAADKGYRGAAGRFRELGIPFWLAVTLLEHAELLRDGEAAGARRRGAVEIFEALCGGAVDRAADACSLARPVGSPDAYEVPAGGGSGARGAVQRRERAQAEHAERQVGDGVRRRARDPAARGCAEGLPRRPGEVDERERVGRLDAPVLGRVADPRHRGRPERAERHAGDDDQRGEHEATVGPRKQRHDDRRGREPDAQRHGPPAAVREPSDQRRDRRLADAHDQEHRTDRHGAEAEAREVERAQHGHRAEHERREEDQPEPERHRAIPERVPEHARAAAAPCAPAPASTPPRPRARTPGSRWR